MQTGAEVKRLPRRPPTHGKRTHLMRYFFAILILLLLGSDATGQVLARARVDSTRMLIGDQVRLHLAVRAPQGGEMQPLNLEKLNEDPVEFIAQTEWEQTTDGFQKTVVFTVWDSGYHVVPPLPVVFLQNGQADTVTTNDIPMEVSTVPAPDLADIKDIIEEPETWRDYLHLIIGASVVLLAVLLIFLVMRMGKERDALPAAPPPPPLLPHELALKNLGILRSEKLWQQGQVKNYHSRLTHIVREYLEERYGIQALEQTTDEILAQLHQAGLGVELTEKLTALLQTADLVKFAKAEPPADYHERAMDLAEEFVKETQKITPENEEGSDSSITNQPAP